MLSRQDTVCADLCKALLSADIPLNKLDNPELKGFLEKEKKQSKCRANVVCFHAFVYFQGSHICPVLAKIFNLG